MTTMTVTVYHVSKKTREYPTLVNLSIPLTLTRCCSIKITVHDFCCFRCVTSNQIKSVY